MSDLMHLAQFAVHGPTDHSLAAWRHPRSTQPYPWADPRFYESIAATCERGKFDMLFFADFNMVHHMYEDSFESAVRHAVQTPAHDPLPLAAWLAAGTTHLGLGVTLTLSQLHPYFVARLFGTLDHMTSGRIGWNVVTTPNKDETIVGYDEIRGHDSRYDRAEEFLEVCYKLWRSWDADALIEDAESGEFADPSRVHSIDHEGTFFRSRGPLSVSRSPQTGPAIIQAGASEKGRSFAGRHAEAIFAVSADAGQAATYSGQMRDSLADADRNPADCKILFGVQTFVADTESRAQELVEEHNELVPLEGALSLLSGHIARDFSKDDPNAPYPSFEAPGSRGVHSVYAQDSGSPTTLAEVAYKHGRSVGLPQVAGTPEQVSDWLEAFRADSGGDGFMLSAHCIPGAITDFVDRVVPILQERGQFRREYTGTTLREHLGQVEPG